MAEIDITALKAKLAKFGQEHLLQFWDSLSAAERKALAADVESVDFEQLGKDFVRANEGSKDTKLDALMQPVADSIIGHSTADPFTPDMLAWEEKGMQLISENKVAALLLAGGQGTRLGSQDPKGMYPLGLPSGKTLYHIQGERIAKLQQLVQKRFGKACVIPWYIMTSDATQEPTKAFFKANNYFGLDEANIIFFEQNVIPALDMKGKAFLETKSKIFRAPDGNGGLYGAMKGKVLPDMIKRGVEHVHVYCVDNILVTVADPVFIGFCASKNAPAGGLVVPKSGPHEKVGVVCTVSGKYQVVEYSEITKATSEATNPDGKLKFNAGNICNHYFTTKFLELACAKCNDLKIHVAEKKIPYVDSEGNVVTPKAINGIKMEKFVFDVFEFADALALLEVKREATFSPLKNAAGESSCTVNHCRSDLYALNRQRLARAGVTFVDENDKELLESQLSELHVCEVLPEASYRGEGLVDFAKANPRLKFPVVVNAADIKAAEENKRARVA